MVLPYVSDMSLDELDSFIRNNRESMRLSPADEIALHLRRQRRAYVFGRERPAMRFARRSLRVLLLGDETEAKRRLAAQLLQHSGAAGASSLLELDDGDGEGEGGGEAVGNGNGARAGTGAGSGAGIGSGAGAGTGRVELLAPSASDAAAALRGELCAACDVLVVCFAADGDGDGGDGLKRALDAVRERWWKEEAAPAFAALAREAKDAKESRGHAWPVAPVIVAGMRYGTPAAAHAQADALRLAQEMGASKYMELSVGSSRHARALLAQCMQLAETVRVACTPDRADFVAAAKDCALRFHLRVPPPRATIDTAARQLRVYVTPGITYKVTIDDPDPRKDLSITYNPNDGYNPSPHVKHSGGHYRNGGRVIAVPSDGVVDLRLLRVAPGTVLRLSGHARCAYASTVVNLTFPSMTQPPAAYIDVALRRFTVIPGDIPLSQCNLRYTLDGSAPTAASPAYERSVALEPTKTESYEAWQPWRSAASPPRVVRIAAFAEDELPSAIVSHTVPGVLETPRIVYTAHGSTFSLDATTVSPFVEYRYTLDGTTPSTTSPLYTGPVSLSATTARQIRVVAFPIAFFPSREAVLSLPTTTAPKQEDPASTAFHITRSVMLRGEHAAQKLQSLSLNEEREKMQQERRQSGKAGSVMPATISTNTPPPLLSPSRRTGTPTLRTELRAAASRVSCRRRSDENIVSRGSDENDAKCSARTSGGSLIAQGRDCVLDSSPALKARTPRVATSEPKNIFKHSNRTRLKNGVKGGKSSDTKRRLDDLDEEGDTSPLENPGGVRCTADDNTVIFDFPDSISLSHITVTTPGNGAGPSSYDVEAKHVHGNDFMTVGSGELRDISGVQTLKVLLSARSFPIDRVRCVFSGGSTGNEAAGSFRVEDIKVHGRPFSAS